MTTKSLKDSIIHPAQLGFLDFNLLSLRRGEGSRGTVRGKYYLIPPSIQFLTHRAMRGVRKRDVSCCWTTTRSNADGASPSRALTSFVAHLQVLLLSASM